MFYKNFPVEQCFKFLVFGLSHFLKPLSHSGATMRQLDTPAIHLTSHMLIYMVSHMISHMTSQLTNHIQKLLFFILNMILHKNNPSSQCGDIISHFPQCVTAKINIFTYLVFLTRDLIVVVLKLIFYVFLYSNCL